MDGGPDENPRYAKSVEVAIHHFKMHNLDAIFVATNAPGRSAFNIVERRMAPLTRLLCGVILPHDKWGNHLDAHGNTFDENLERKNFQNAGETLAEVWGENYIDGHAVFAEYIDPDKSELSKADLVKVSEEWKAEHISSSQYFLQIVKCHNKDCCGPFRSKLGTFFPHRFLPAPVMIEYNPQVNVASDSGLITHHDGSARFATLFQNMALFDSSNIAYDSFCPSMKDKICARTCTECNAYFASITMLKNHRKIHTGKHAGRQVKQRPSKIFARREEEMLVSMDEECWEVEWLDEEELEVDGVPFINNDDLNKIPVVDMSQHFNTIWESDK